MLNLKCNSLNHKVTRVTTLLWEGSLKNWVVNPSLKGKPSDYDELVCVTTSNNGAKLDATMDLARKCKYEKDLEFSGIGFVNGYIWRVSMNVSELDKTTPTIASQFYLNATSSSPQVLNAVYGIKYVIGGGTD